MKIFSQVVICLIGYIIAANGEVQQKFNIVTPLDYGSNSRVKFINNVLENAGDYGYGWIDLEVLEYQTRNMKIQISNGKAICANGPNAISLKIVEKNLVSEDDENLTYMITVEYINQRHNVELPNPLPVTVSKFSKYEEFIINMELDSKFEGYLVCTKTNTQAFLVPKQEPKVDFVSPTWSIKVKIDIYRNPIAIYGRMFRIINLDNISVLQNQRREFFFTLKRNQLYLIYYLYLAMKDQAKGKYCTLSRSLDYEAPLLECESFKESTRPKVINSFFMWSFIGSAIFNMTNSFFFRKSKSDEPIETEGSPEVVPHNNPTSVKTPLILRTDRSEELMNQKDITKSKRKVFNVTTLPLLLGWISYNLYEGISRVKTIINNIRELRQQYIKAPFAYNWSLTSIQ